MIQRFEDEYPECRVPANVEPSSDHTASTADDPLASETSTFHSSFNPTGTHSNATLPGSISSMNSASTVPNRSTEWYSDDEDDVHPTQTLRSRHASDVSLAAKALTIEEGRVHRIGQKVKRDLLAEGHGQWPGEERIESELREKLAGFGDERGDEGHKAHQRGDENEVAVV